MPMNSTPDIRLFVACHKLFPVPENELLYPIHVGAALSDVNISGYLRDDAGENISARNRSYCELTGQYWAWKNVDADFYGFFHYRRYLYPDPDAKYPYIISSEPTEQVLKWLEFQRFPQLIEQYEMIAPIGEDMHISVREHYLTSRFHHAKDIFLLEQIVRELYPTYVPAMEGYFGGSICYFGNMYIMAKPVFDDYCQWLFSILEEFDRRADLTGYGMQERRVDGFLAERLFGVYYTHRKAELKCIELPRIFFEPDTQIRVKKKSFNAFFPPGTKRRAAVKKIFTKIQK